MIKIATVIGARPQFVKACMITRALAALGKDMVQEVLIHTGQHYSHGMSAVFFQEMGLPGPDHLLGIRDMRHGAMTGRMTEALEQVLLQESPDLALLYGDTNSTLAGALAAVKLHIPAAHVEAGLRSWNRRMPEEINRVIADHAASLLFAPTDCAVENLQKEGFGGDVLDLRQEPFARLKLDFDAPPLLLRTGDVMQDAAIHFAQRVDQARIEALLARAGAKAGSYAVCTLHRPANVDAGETLCDIFEGLGQIAGMLPVIMPLHPRTRSRMQEFGIQLPRDVQAIEPVGYLDMLGLLGSSALVITDSGGVQKEAYFVRRPCVTVRAETEWRELVEHGCTVLTPPEPRAMVQACQRQLGFRDWPGQPLYGEGDTAERIARLLGNLEKE